MQSTVTGPSQAQVYFGTADHGWEQLTVARYRGHEALSRLYRYEVTLIVRDRQEPLDLDALLNLPATLAIQTESHWRPVHGIITQAALVDHTETHQLYEISLEPPLVRSGHRRRCRTFIDHSVKDVVDILLQNLSHDNREGAGGLAPRQDEPMPWQTDFELFIAPASYYRWLVVDHARITSKALRDYIVQYNETDLELLERLLAEEGISFFFQHGADGVVLSLADQPGRPSPYPAERRALLRRHSNAGADLGTQVVTSIRSDRRLLPSSVTARDYSWKRTQQPYEVTAPPEAANEHANYFMFPGRDESAPGEPCSHPADVQMDRFETARLTTYGRGTLRTLRPGYVFKLEDPASLHGDHDYLTVAIDCYGVQHDLPEGSAELDAFGVNGERAEPGVHRCRFAVLPAAVRFRPLAPRAKPRIDGVHTAIVTAEELEGDPPEIHADPFGRVRVRFPWDQRPADGGPSSCWLRVSQAWAGKHWGTLHTPRVGHEVLVTYLQGDPERPIVVGRVYNGQAKPPYNPEEQPTISTIKSLSSPNGEQGYNELRMQDLTGNEEIYLHAQRNLTEVVRNAHMLSVGSHETITIGGHREITVNKTRLETVLGHAYTKVDGNDEHYIVGERSVHSDKDHKIDTPATLTLQAGEAKLVMSTGFVRLENGTGASVTLLGPDVFVHGDGLASIHGKAAAVHSSTDGDVSVSAGAKLALSATKDASLTSKAAIDVEASANVVVKAAQIHLN